MSFCLLELDADEVGECALEAPLHVRWLFRVPEAVAGGVWTVSYMVDVAHHAHEVVLGQTDAAECAAGEQCRAAFSCARLELAHLAPSWLNNVGMLMLRLRDAEGGERACVSLVAQVASTPAGFTRRLVRPPLDTT